MDAVFWAMAYRADPARDTAILPHRDRGHGPKGEEEDSSLLVDATLRASDDGLPLDVLIYDLSMTGFRMETSEALDAEAMIWIGIAGTRVNAAVVARRQHRAAGDGGFSVNALGRSDAALRHAVAAAHLPRRRRGRGGRGD